MKLKQVSSAQIGDFQNYKHFRSGRCFSHDYSVFPFNRFIMLYASVSFWTRRPCACEGEYALLPQLCAAHCDHESRMCRRSDAGARKASEKPARQLCKHVLKACTRIECKVDHIEPALATQGPPPLPLHLKDCKQESGPGLHPGHHTAAFVYQSKFELPESELSLYPSMPINVADAPCSVHCS